MRQQQPSPVIIARAFQTRPELARFAKRTHARYQRWFKTKLSLPTIVILQQRRLVREFWKSAQDDWKVGWYRNKVIYLLDQSLAERSRGDWYRLLGHELAHPFINYVSEGKAPRWLNEGLASRLAGQRQHRATPKEVVTFFRQRKSPNNLNVYGVGRVMTDEVLARYGRQKILQFLKQIAKTRTISLAFRQTFGLSWHDHMRAYQTRNHTSLLNR